MNYIFNIFLWKNILYYLFIKYFKHKTNKNFGVFIFIKFIFSLNENSYRNIF